VRPDDAEDHTVDALQLHRLGVITPDRFDNLILGLGDRRLLTVEKRRHAHQPFRCENVEPETSLGRQGARSSGADRIGVVIDRQFTTSRSPDDLPAFCGAIIEQFSRAADHAIARRRRLAHTIRDDVLIVVMVRWSYNFFMHGRGARLIAGAPDPRTMTPPPAGGDAGRATASPSPTGDRA
jgi:hypothetical protein